MKVEKIKKINFKEKLRNLKWKFNWTAFDFEKSIEQVIFFDLQV